jgi:predicted nucleotidyltransferase
VAGGGDERSDIDIGIEASEPIPLATLAMIKNDLEECNIIYKLDLVDFKRVSEEFKNFALKNIEPIVWKN